MATRKFVYRSYIASLANMMVEHHAKAALAANEANRIVATALDQYAAGEKYFSATDAEKAATSSLEWQVKVGANQMYDRWATRDASVLSALLQAVQMGFVDVKEDTSIRDPDKYCSVCGRGLKYGCSHKTEKDLGKRT
jgi:hypothetical protein